MKINISYEKLDKLKSEIAVFILDQEKKFYETNDKDINALIEKAMEDFKKGKIKKEIYYTFPEDKLIKRILLYWTGLNTYYNVWENVKIFSAKSLDFCKNYNLTQATIIMNSEEALPFIGKVIEGAILGSYSFDKYKKEKNRFFDSFNLEIIGNDKFKEKNEFYLKRYKIVSEAVNECRDIINEPGSVVYPEVLAEKAEEIAKKYGMEIKVWHKKELEKEGYNGLLQVGKGSIHPPCLIMMKYKGGGEKNLSLIGKGITFDTGGISLKPAAKMYEMKGDMAGGAAVIYAMKAIGEMQVPVNITAIIPAAENIPDANAQRPGDIFYAKNGKSIMVDSTDAEGRLILTDAFYLAGEQKCSHIVDIATLTGSCVRALGTSIAGIFGNNENFIKAVIEAGKRHGEIYWQLPLIEEYKEMLKTTYADLNNIGGQYAGAITAALFLREFVPENTPWVHLDIAGPYIQDKQWKYYEAGATAFGLKTLVALAENFNEYVKDYNL